jgi:hypothetical protein
MSEDKVVRDGKVAIVVSPEYGAGISTWGDISPMEPLLVQAVEENKGEDWLQEKCEEKFGEDFYNYWGGLDNAVVEWLPEGTPFFISEYDGWETLETSKRLSYTA